MSSPESAASSMTVAELVTELEDMLEKTLASSTLLSRLGRDQLTVCYELVDADGTVHPYLMSIRGTERGIRALEAVAEDADVVLRATPMTLHNVTTGAMGGREAIMSGQMDIKKAPSLPKLLLMRGLFNQYKKIRARQTRS
jgi:putative sterol carrier protein